MSEGVVVLDAIRRRQPDTLTPTEAMSLLYELKQKLSKRDCSRRVFFKK